MNKCPENSNVNFGYINAFTQRVSKEAKNIRKSLLAIFLVGITAYGSHHYFKANHEKSLKNINNEFKESISNKNLTLKDLFDFITSDDIYISAEEKHYALINLLDINNEQYNKKLIKWVIERIKSDIALGIDIQDLGKINVNPNYIIDILDKTPHSKEKKELVFLIYEHFYKPLDLIPAHVLKRYLY